MSSPLDTPCRLTSLGRWCPENHLLGLQSSFSSVTMDRRFFGCCAGDGVQIDSSNPKDARICSLPRRWYFYSRLIFQWSGLANSEDLSLFGRADLSEGGKTKDLSKTSIACLQTFFRRELDALLRSQQGRIIDLKILNDHLRSSLSPRELGQDVDDVCSRIAWLVAACLTWHFDVCVLPFRVFSASNANSVSKGGNNYLPLSLWTDLLSKNKSGRRIMLVDGVSELWNANRLETMEALVAFASEHHLPVWIFDQANENLSESGEEKRSATRNFRSSVNKRLSQARAKPSIHWLSDQAKSRLSELCRFDAVPANNPEIPDIV